MNNNEHLGFLNSRLSERLAWSCHVQIIGVGLYIDVLEINEIMFMVCWS